MNIERALNIYRTYTVTKIAALDKQNLAMQYAQCGELVKLQKQIDRANQTSLSILRNQEKELKRQEAQRYYKSLAFNLNRSLTVISECDDVVKRCFLSDLYLAPISAFADICEKRLDEIADKEYASEIKKKADDLKQEAGKFTKQYEQSLYHRLKELNEQKQSNAISNEIIEKEKQLAAYKTEVSASKEFKKKSNRGCFFTLLAITAFYAIYYVGVALGIGSENGGSSISSGDAVGIGLFMIVLVALTYFAYGKMKRSEENLRKERRTFNDQLRQKKSLAQTSVEHLKQEIESLRQKEIKLTDDYNSIKQTLNNNDSEWTKEMEELTSLLPQDTTDHEEKYDSLIIDVAKYFVKTQCASTSIAQRKYSIGYNRAGRLMKQLEDIGVLHQTQKSESYNVLVSTEQELDEKLRRAQIIN